VKQNFLQRFSNFKFRKKRDEKKGKKEEGRAQFVFNYHIPFHKSNNPTYHLFLIKKLVIWF